MNNLIHQQYIRKILNIEGERLQNLEQQSREKLEVILLNIFNKTLEEMSLITIDLSNLSFYEYEELKFSLKNWYSCVSKKEIFELFISEYANKKTYIPINKTNKRWENKIIATHMNLDKEQRMKTSYYHQVANDIISTKREENYFEYKEIYYDKLKKILIQNYNDREQYENLIEVCDAYRQEQIRKNNSKKTKIKIK